MHDIVEFLRRQSPFDALSEEELERLSETVEVEFFSAGETIIEQGDVPVEHPRVIRRGSVELLDRGEAIDLLEEGEMFGHPSMLSGLPTGWEVRAVEDSLCYRMPAEAAVSALSRPAGLRYVARSLLDRLMPRAPGAGIDPARVPVARLVNGRTVICRPQETVREAARRMAEAEASAALVRLEDGELGILTDHDLRDQVIAGELGADAPVTEVMTAPAYTVTPERFASEVMLEMLDHGIRHVPVVWPQGDVLGILSDRDIMIAETQAPFALRRAIEEAPDIESLRPVIRQLWPAVITLHDAEVSPAQVASIIAVVVDAVTRRLIDLEVGRLGELPYPITWLAMGSLGRREVVPSSDVDSALIWDGREADVEAGAYMSELGGRIVAELSDCGFVSDLHGATAAKPIFDAASDRWQSTIRTATTEPETGRALIFLSLVTDARPVCVLGEEHDPLENLHRSLQHRRGLLQLMLRLALGKKPPSGLRHLRGRGSDKGRLDIKAAGVLPVANAARYASLAAGVHQTTTRERLRLAALGGTLETADARALREAYELFWRLRLDHQVEQLRSGEDPDDIIDVEALDPLTRRYLRDAFDAVRSVQHWLRKEHGLP